MNTDELIGLVATSYLRNRLTNDVADGVARFLLDCLSAGQTAAVAHCILKDQQLSAAVEIKLPANFVSDFGLPLTVLTTERTTYFRNAACSKTALLVANTGDDEEQSLKDLVPIGSSQLLSHPEIWIDLVSAGLPLSPDHKVCWIKSLQALLEVSSLALDRIAEYVLRTQEAVSDGQPILSALGSAFPSLRSPRDTGIFRSLNDKNAKHISKWKNLYQQVFKKRTCYLLKHTPSHGLLLKEELNETFARVKDSIPTTLHLTITNFIESPSGWNQASAQLSNEEWELIKPLFDGLRREKFNLGKATQEFYDDRDSGLLTNDERDYLQRLADHSRTEAQDDDRDFYWDHRDELKEDLSLKSKWDRLVFGTPLDCEDFLVGLMACLEYLFDQKLPSTKRVLKITCDRRSKKDLKDVNEEAGIFFARKYANFNTAFGKSITWAVGELFNFVSLSDQWRGALKPYRNKSVGKSALQLKFLLELEVALLNGSTETFSKQLIWNYNPSSIASEFAGDIARLANNAFVYASVGRETVSAKGRLQSLDLLNVATLYPSYGQDRGSLIPVYRKDNDIALLWKNNLEALNAEGILPSSVKASLLMAFEDFHKLYSTAVRSYFNSGICISEFRLQAVAYGKLLMLICTDAKGDRNRERLLKPLLQLGLVTVNGPKPSVIVPPWHPLRLSAIANKLYSAVGLIRHLITSKDINFGDTRLFFQELKQEYSHPVSPEIALGWDGPKSELLSLSDWLLDYSLHELPVASNEVSNDTNESPAETSNLIVDLTKRFLALYPHERANLSLVLYNCDSARLPYAVVNKMNELHEDEEDMRCQIILRHRDGLKLRELYETIIESSDADADTFVASESAKDFMARLRIGIMADQAPAPDPKDGPPNDIVFLQDVIARHARLEWYPEICKPINPDAFKPLRWSKRRPSPVDDMKSVSYLCCPAQDESGWAYITANTTFIKGDWDGVESKRLLPVRQLDFSDPNTSSIFKEIHNLGAWVVNFDELLDRRQLLNQGVKVIRYKQTATQGRNVIISSNTSLTLLRAMVLSRIKDLTLGISEAEAKEIADKFINEANDISGDIVLRAAKRGRNASELMGIVLSRYLLRSELGSERKFGWYFLDDYAEWLGQKEQQIADILTLSPVTSVEGKPLLAVLICESKYIDYSGLTSKRQESQKQLRDTVRRIDDALFGAPERLDRDLWLSRFSDLLLNGIQFPAHSPIDLSFWRRAVREGECGIYLRGYSHVFISGPTDAPECSETMPVPDLNGSFQEIFSRSRLRELVLSYWKWGADPTPIRRAVAGVDLWNHQEYKLAKERIRYTTHASKSAPTDDGNELPGEGDDMEGHPKSPSPPKPPAGDSHPIDPASAQSGKTASMMWKYPQLTELFHNDRGNAVDSDDDVSWLNQTEGLCRGALQQFQLTAKILTKSLTPNTALLKYQGGANLTVEQVNRRRSEFLTTHKLNVIAVRAEAGMVAISVARPHRKVLSLPDVWKTWAGDSTYGNQELLIAVREEDSQPLFISPRKNAPHTLIAGSTGSGKSVLMQNIILGIACTNTPEQAKIVLIDPKLGVDYFAMESLPHLDGGIIDNDVDAISKLNDLIVEMNRRYAILRQNKVPNIFELNKKPNATERLPFLWVIHDEFAEWMMLDSYADSVTNVVSRLGVKARAAGIALVFAAQRPDATVMPMQLRSNLGNRLILRVDSEGTSEIALGEKGAERLLGKGHLAAKLEGEAGIVYAQVPYVDASVLENIVSLCR